MTNKNTYNTTKIWNYSNAFQTGLNYYNLFTLTTKCVNIFETNVHEITL